MRGLLRDLAGNAAGIDAAAEEGSLETALAVHAAAAEARRLARGEKAVDRAAVRAQRAALEVGLDAAHALAADHELADRHQRASAAVENVLEVAGADAVAGPAAQRRDAPQLLVAVEALAAADGRVVAGDRGLHRCKIHDGLTVH